MKPSTLEYYLRELRRIEEHREATSEYKIRRSYKTLVKDLEDFLGEYYSKYAEDGQLTHELLHKHRRHARFIEEAQEKLIKSNKEVAANIMNTVRATYKASFEGVIDAVNKSKDYYDLKVNLKGLGITPSILKNAVSNSFVEEALEKNHSADIYNLKQQLGIGLLNGDRIETVAKRINNELDKSYNKAILISRTETHRIREAGYQDSSEAIAKNLDDDRVMVKVWKTMKDERVRRPKGKSIADHVKMEGVTVLVDDVFTLPSGATAKTPGQSGVASEDINCRCYLSRDFMTIAEFEALTGKKQVKVVKPTYVPQKTIVEAEQYASKFAESVSYKGATNLDNVNVLNETLDELITRFPINKLKTLTTNSRLSRSNARAHFGLLEINTKFLNSDRTATDWQVRIANNQKKIEQYKTYLGNGNYNQAAVRKALRELEEECRFTRWSVSSESASLADTIRHEYGHIVADQYIGQINDYIANPHFNHRSDNKLWKLKCNIDDVFKKAKKNGDIYKISKYASTESAEFFAETFSMYVKGETLPDYITEMLEEVLKGGIL